MCTINHKLETETVNGGQDCLYDCGVAIINENNFK